MSRLGGSSTRDSLVDHVNSRLSCSPFSSAPGLGHCPTMAKALLAACGASRDQVRRFLVEGGK